MNGATSSLDLGGFNIGATASGSALAGSYENWAYAYGARYGNFTVHGSGLVGFKISSSGSSQAAGGYYTDGTNKATAEGTSYGRLYASNDANAYSVQDDYTQVYSSNGSDGSDSSSKQLTVWLLFQDGQTGHFEAYNYAQAHVYGWNPVPLPGAVWLFGSALAGIMIALSRRESPIRSA